MAAGIMEFLDENKKVVDNLMEELIPRKADDAFLRRVAGNPTYAYDVIAAQKAVCDPFWDLIDRGGKRWRPALFMLVACALGARKEDVEKYSIIPEIIHNGTLIVDDVEDSADSRRAKPCLHNIFGVDIAVNVGNAMYFLPLKLLIENSGNIDCPRIEKAYGIYSQEMINLSLGQAMDIWWHNGESYGTTEEQYLQMCSYKTGTLARMSAKMAAAIAGGTEAQELALGRFAETIGVAFQIQDDILDIISTNREKFGKSFGNDIHEGKQTLMVIHTLKQADPDDRKRLIEILRMGTRDEGLIREAISIMEKYDSIEYAKSLAKKLVSEAWDDADKVLCDSESKALLQDFARYLIERDF